VLGVSTSSQTSAFGLKKKTGATGYYMANGQTDRRTVRTSAKNVYNTLEVVAKAMGTALAALLYEAHILKRATQTQ
jgi:hypothetical protein